MKFFIVGAQCSGKHEVIEYLKTDHPEINIGKLFTNIDSDKDIYRNMDDFEIFTENEIRDIFENKAYIFMKEIEESSYKYYEGLSSYTFDNKDVFTLTPDELVKIPNVALNDEICFIWLDDNMKNRFNRYKTGSRKYSFQEREQVESAYSNDFVSNIYSFPNSKLIYFFNEDPGRVSTIIYALYKNNSLIEEFSKKFN